MKHLSDRIWLAAAVMLLGAPVAAPAWADLNDGLVGYWAFDEGSGTVAHDSSGNGHHGVLHGTGWAGGVSGAGLYFDGVDDYVEIPNSPDLNPPDVTVALWVKTTASGDHRSVVEKWDCSGPYPYNVRVVEGKGRFGVYDGTQASSAASVSLVNDDVWHQIVGVRSTATDVLYLYVDGQKQGEVIDATSGPLANVTDVLVGKRGCGYYFVGHVDEIRIYSRPLNATEILDLYWAVRPVPPPENTEGEQDETAGTSNDPVNTATGNFFHQETDLTAATRGGLMAFTRYYNSAAVGRSRQLSAVSIQPRDAQPQSPTGATGPPCLKNESTDASGRCLRAFDVALAALPGVGLCCWLVQRRLRARTRASLGRVDAQTVQRVVHGPRHRKHVGNRGRMGGRSACVQAGGIK